jgi:hypothetical protein
MKAVPQKKTDHKAAPVPVWLRDPKSTDADREWPQRHQGPRVTTLHEDLADDEPGYGHGV